MHEGPEVIPLLDKLEKQIVIAQIFCILEGSVHTEVFEHGFGVQMQVFGVVVVVALIHNNLVDGSVVSGLDFVDTCFQETEKRYHKLLLDLIT
jgi:hypothetical protein